MYTGDDPNYLNNPLCQSTPALQKDDPNNYYWDRYAGTRDNENDPFGYGNGWVHKNGVQIECNLFGKYVNIVINMQNEIGNGYEFEICSLAILGSTYER